MRGECSFEVSALSSGTSQKSLTLKTTTTKKQKDNKDEVFSVGLKWIYAECSMTLLHQILTLNAAW